MWRILEVRTIIIDTEENDDWMKTLPGYKDERALFDALTLLKQSPARSSCMSCSKPPEIDVQWADGRGRAWFCKECYQKWNTEEAREIVRAWYVTDGEVPKKLDDHKRSERVDAKRIFKGGTGSGHYGHSGRPGKVGGSLPGAGAFNNIAAGGDITVSEADLNMFLNGGKYLEDVDWDENDRDRDVRVKQQIVADIAKRSGLSEAECNLMVRQWAKSSNDHDMRSLALQVDAAEELGLELSDWQKGNILELQQQRDVYIAKGLLSKDFNSLEDAYEGYRNVWQDEYKADYENYKLIVQRKLLDVATYNGTAGGYVPLYDSERQRKFIRAMYDNTQERLKGGSGIYGTVKLYRGVKEGVDESLRGNVILYAGNTMESWSVSENVAREFGDRLLYAVVPVENVIGTARTGFGCLTEGEFVITPGTGAEVYVYDDGVDDDIDEYIYDDYDDVDEYVY